MKQFKFVIAVSCILFFQSSVWSQQGTWRLDLNYKVGIPTGNLKNLTDETSLRGWSGFLSHGINDRLAVGLETGFQDFYQQYPRQIIHESGSDLSAVITNSIQTIPVLVKAKYKLTEGGPLQPFAALGVGGNLIQYRKFYGQFSESYSKIGFAAQPELGIHAPVGKAKRLGVQLAAAYNIMPFQDNDADGLNHVSVKAGLSIPLR